MANEQNLKPFKTVKEARDSGRKGGIASGQARKERKTIQKILIEFLNVKCSDSKQFKRIAAKLGIESEKSIKELLTYLAIINTAKNANLDELSKLTKLIGEMPEMNDNNEDVKETLIKIKECAHEQGNIDKQ